ncbi:MAG: type I-C CRISPR-associated protein Cas5c [Deltaproteobacteria bacterium]|nr:type I-C CRISPR-associated protein Cas5c [Deltaproteobacteria bacterium]
MSRGVRLRVWGPWACFTRPEMKVERVSYDVMTPSAARGILEAVYWKPAIRWVIRRIHVLKPIVFTNIRRNELGGKPALRPMKTAMKDGRTPLGVFIEDDRQQRAATVLREVDYLIEAEFQFTGPEDNNPGKHLDSFNRRAARGQCYHRPYLGCREFAAEFALAGEDLPPTPSEFAGERDLGWVLHDLDFGPEITPRFFRATMRDGVVEVPPWDAPGVAS